MIECKYLIVSTFYLIFFLFPELVTVRRQKRQEAAHGGGKLDGRDLAPVRGAACLGTQLRKQADCLRRRCDNRCKRARKDTGGMHAIHPFEIKATRFCTLCRT